MDILKKESEIFVKAFNLMRLVKIDKDNNPIFTNEAIALIHELADEARETDTYKIARGFEPIGLSEESASFIYGYMLHRLVDMSITHTVLVPTVFLPPLADALKREEKE